MSDGPVSPEKSNNLKRPQFLKLSFYTLLLSFLSACGISTDNEIKDKNSLRAMATQRASNPDYDASREIEKLVRSNTLRVRFDDIEKRKSFLASGIIVGSTKIENEQTQKDRFVYFLLTTAHSSGDQGNVTISNPLEGKSWEFTNDQFYTYKGPKGYDMNVIALETEEKLDFLPVTVAEPDVHPPQNSGLLIFGYPILEEIKDDTSFVELEDGAWFQAVTRFSDDTIHDDKEYGIYRYADVHPTVKLTKGFSGSPVFVLKDGILNLYGIVKGEGNTPTTDEKPVIIPIASALKRIFYGDRGITSRYPNQTDLGFSFMNEK